MANNIEQKFSEWYQSIFPGCSGDQLELRISSVKEYAESDQINVQELVKLFFELPYDEDESTLFDVIFENDKTFLKKNTRELACLAGMVMYYLLENGSEYSDEIILLILSLSTVKSEVILLDFLHYVQNRMNDLTAGYREISVAARQNLTTMGHSKLSEKLSGEWDEDTKTAVVNIISKIASNVLILKENENTLMKNLDICSEDSAILSWIVGGYSNDLKCILNKKISSKEISIILGKELSNLVKMPLGPFAAEGFLSRMIGLCKLDNTPCSIIDIVNSTPREWRMKFINNLEEVTIFTPIMFAILKSTESDNESDWGSVFSHRYGCDVAEIKYSPLQWSYRMYIECLVNKFYYE